MEEVTAFIDDGNLNSETFFVDEDEAPPADGFVGPISVAGCFCFDIASAAPFNVVVRTKGKSKALAKFETACNATARNSIKQSLVDATKAYTTIADALDAEMEAEMEDEEGGEAADGGVDVLDALNDAAVNEANEETRRKKEEMAAALEEINRKYDLTGLNKVTVDRILSDYQKIAQAKPFGWTAQPDGRQLNHWTVEINDFEKGTPLHKDMEKVKGRTGKAAIEMTMTFPKEYPYKPPFIRVVRPRFMPRTGRVTIGGSICTELLTDDGWKPIYDIEAIMETIRQQITDPESGAKIDHSNTHDYTLAEAKEAFERVAAYHKQNGW